MKLIINRITEWFDTDYPELDVYYVCVKLLEKLERNKVRGIEYDKLSLINIVTPNRSKEMMQTIDKSVIYMVSRGLIEKRKVSDFRIDLFITDLGVDVLHKIEEKRNEIK